MSRLALLALGFPLFVPLFVVAAVPGAAQTMPPAQTGRAPGKIDIRVDTTPEAGTYEDCEDDQDAAIITGEIVVCRKRSDEENRLYDKESAERRHAQRTMNHNEIPAPDVAGDGIFRGPATVSGLCFIPPCPKPPAYMIDFATLPDAPPGSDADRIARGLAPRGNSNGTVTPPPAPAQGQQDNAEVLGLPPPLETDEASRPEEVNRSGSASPEDEPSG
ncbi:hypothetical protein [Qipengyuania sp. NPDC077563]|uniref:hypothetical protein n=1 Tax=Qipengyuania sp. NPDC077563 TaxID=3364497 RepID=UPI00384AB96A